MFTKEEHYQHVLKEREMVADPAFTRCTCPNTLCDWHGKCKECVAIHRHHQNHLPFCLQPIIREKAGALAAIAEMELTHKQEMPIEYRRYVKERDEESK